MRNEIDRPDKSMPDSIESAPEQAVMKEQISGMRDKVAFLPTIDPALLALADVDRDLTVEEAREVLEQIPLIVHADDEEMIRRTMVRFMARIKQGGMETISDTYDSSELSPNVPGQLQVLLGKTGKEAEDHLKSLANQTEMNRGLIIFDNNMHTGKTGLELIREYGSKLPPAFACVLQSGDADHATLDSIRKAKEEGSLDAFLQKPVMPETARTQYMKAYLRRQRKAIEAPVTEGK